MDLVCPKCGAPSGVYGGHRIRGCACEMANAQPRDNPFNAAKGLPEPITDHSYNVLKEIIAIECSDTQGNLSSHSKFHFAKAIKILADRNEVSIISERGPIIKAQWN